MAEIGTDVGEGEGEVEGIVGGGRDTVCLGEKSSKMLK